MTESQILQKFFKELKTNIKTHEVKLLDAYLDHYASDSVHKYDRGFSLSSPDLKKILKSNQFQTKLKRLGYKLSLFGSGWGLAIFRYKNKSHIQVVKITHSDYEFGVLREVYFLTDKTITIKDSEEDTITEIHGRFFIDENEKIQKETGYYVQGVWNVKDEAIEYDTKVIPVMEFDNNALRTPDITTESRNIIRQAEEFFNKIPGEFEKGKVIFAFNNLINSQNDGKDFKDKVIEGGADTYDVTDPDGIIANSIAPITAGMTAIETIEKIYGFYDNRAREISFQFRDHGSDTRKSEFDLMLFNQKAFEYMMSKIEHRQDQLQSFIDLLAEVEGVDTKNVTLKISEFEQNRIDNLKAITDLKVAQAAQAKGIAKKNTSEAKAIDSGTAKSTAPTAVTSDLNIDNVETKAK